MSDRRDIEELARLAIDAGFHIHSELGPGLFESVYEAMLVLKLSEVGLSVQRQMPINPVATTAELGIAPEWIEAIAFAWLAKQTLNRQSGNLCAVTGAKKAVILGGIYFA